MTAKHTTKSLLGSLVLAAALSGGASAADQSAANPFDAKAREIFAKVISIPSQLGSDKVPEVAEYLASEFRAAGFPAEDIHVIPFKLPGDNTAALVVRYRGDGSGGKPILLLAHMDVVTAKREDWVRDPFKLTEEDGFFYGRGTYDVKHGVTEITATLLRLKKEGFKPKRDLILFFTGDEETSQRTTVGVVRDHRALIDAEYALNSDGGGGSLDDDTGKPLYFSLQTAEKTYADFLLTVRNPGGHSSTPRKDNAINDLASALSKVADYSFPVMWNDTTIANMRATGKITPGALGAAMIAFAANPKDEAAAAVLAASPSHIGMTRTTCVATRLWGGHAENALPQSATANINCRIFPGVKIPQVQQTLQDVVGKDVEIKEFGEAMSSDASPLRADVVDAVTRAIRKLYPGVAVVPQQSAGATDGLVLRAAGIPTYGVDGTFIRSKDEFAHGLNERIPVDAFYKGLEYWYLLIKDVAGPKKR